MSVTVKRAILGLAVFTVLFLSAAFWRLRAIAVPVSAEGERAAYTYVIDAGHGGEDGGAVSPDGVKESGINLSVARKLDALMHLLGQRTVMVRTEDRAIYDPDAQSVTQKKVSDLRNRVKLVNETGNALLISIHQNEFPQSKYFGAQVFCNRISPAQTVAAQLQADLASALDPDNHRQIKNAEDTVYLMRQIHAPGILVECGFLSNPAEAALLQSNNYQTKLALVIAASVTASIQKEQSGNEGQDNIPVYKLRQ